MNEIVDYESKTYVAIWFNYIGFGEFDIRKTELIEASSYSIAFGRASLINNEFNLYDYRCVVQRIDMSKMKPF